MHHNHSSKYMVNYFVIFPSFIKMNVFESCTVGIWIHIPFSTKGPYQKIPKKTLYVSRSMQESKYSMKFWKKNPSAHSVILP